jgi:uncharacterized damage-inducible protein DinB
METSEVRIANVVFEDRLFLRRLERTLNAELERTNNLLAEQIKLLEERKQLLAEVLKAVEQRWQTEEQSEPIKSAERTEEDSRDE